MKSEKTLEEQGYNEACKALNEGFKQFLEGDNYEYWS